MTPRVLVLLFFVIACVATAGGCEGTRYLVSTEDSTASADPADSNPAATDMGRLAETSSLDGYLPSNLDNVVHADETWAMEDSLEYDYELPFECPPEFPIVLNFNSCVECTDDSHCTKQMECHPGTHSCVPPALCDFCLDSPYPQCIYLEEKWVCVQCLDDDDCSSGHCEEDIYSCVSAVPEDCDLCEPPFPACAEFNGVWSCVQCTEDGHCPNGGWCDTDVYTGNGGQTPTCTGSTEDSQCEELEAALLCDSSTGCCFDKNGWCDGMTAHCHYDAGSECVPVIGPPGVPDDLSLCTCTEPLDPVQLQTCLDLGECAPGDECLGNHVCVGGGGMGILPGGENTGPFCIAPELLALLAM